MQLVSVICRFAVFASRHRQAYSNLEQTKYSTVVIAGGNPCGTNGVQTLNKLKPGGSAVVPVYPCVVIACNYSWQLMTAVNET